MGGRQSTLENVGLTMKRIDENFWKGKKVFLTGHTGFKGSWLSLWLTQLGAIVKGYAIEPPTVPSLFHEAGVAKYVESEIADIRDMERLARSMSQFKPDILIHMAAQSLVRLSYNEPVITYSTNVMGTVSLFEAARKCSNLKAIVNVTTDKCYENNEWVWGYRENEAMGGHDPYSNSKACAELVTSAYRRSFFNSQNGPLLASARAGNVIGGGDWATDRLVPDILRAFEKNKPVVVRNLNAIRPWQHVLEPLGGYLMLAQALYEKGVGFDEGWNFGPHDNDVQPVKWILNHMVKLWGEGAAWHLDSGDHPHEATYLKLDISKAKARLNWSPSWSLDTTLEKITTWHKAWLARNSMDEHCFKEISLFSSTLNSNLD
jgi:CDP-glucose 4,6-dehydratase